MSGGDCVKVGKRWVARAGAKRLHGRRFPPEGLGLDATGAAGPSKKQKIQLKAVVAPSREGSLPEGRRRPSLDFNRGAASGGRSTRRPSRARSAGRAQAIPRYRSGPIQLRLHIPNGESRLRAIFSKYCRKRSVRKWDNEVLTNLEDRSRVRLHCAPDIVALLSGAVGRQWDPVRNRRCQ